MSTDADDGLDDDRVDGDGVEWVDNPDGPGKITRSLREQWESTEGCTLKSSANNSEN